MQHKMQSVSIIEYWLPLSCKSTANTNDTTTWVANASKKAEIKEKYNEDSTKKDSKLQLQATPTLGDS